MAEACSEGLMMTALPAAMAPGRKEAGGDVSGCGKTCSTYRSEVVGG